MKIAGLHCLEAAFQNVKHFQPNLGCQGLNVEMSVGKAYALPLTPSPLHVGCLNQLLNLPAEPSQSAATSPSPLYSTTLGHPPPKEMREALCIGHVVTLSHFNAGGGRNFCFLTKNATKTGT